jgi:O-antigen chain-terminating methyltransferase
VELTEKSLKREMERLFRKQQEVATELALQVSRFSRPLEPTGLVPPAPTLSASEVPALNAFFASFEEYFRGDRETVKQRLRHYIHVMQENHMGTEEMPVLDVACGRGEWLELLREEHLRASGVDSNSVLVSQCLDNGLEVEEADLVDYLTRQPDASLGVVTAFHIAEHLTIEKLIAFLTEAVRVLKSGGLILLETPNPQNVLVGSCNFYFDPTHRNPLPKAVLKFFVESRGFVVTEILELNPSDEQPLAGDSELIKRFNQYFYGPMDYAIVARKVG